MQGFSSALKNRNKNKCAKSVIGEGPRRKLKRNVIPKSEKNLEKQSKEKQESVGRSQWTTGFELW